MSVPSLWSVKPMYRPSEPTESELVIQELTWDDESHQFTTDGATDEWVVDEDDSRDSRYIVEDRVYGSLDEARRAALDRDRYIKYFLPGIQATLQQFQE